MPIYDLLMYVHLASIVPCIFLGAALLMMRKGTKFHNALGRVYMLLMLFTAIVTLFMPAHVGIRFLNHFGFLHLFSILTIWTVPTAYFAIKKGDVNRHKTAMIMLYVGGIIITGAFTLTPGRYLHELFF